MKGMIKRFSCLLLSALAGTVFLLYPSQAKADLLGDIAGWFTDTVQAFIEFIFLDKCPDASHYLSDNLSENSCWICKLFSKVFEAINLLTTAIYNQIHIGCMSLLAVFLAIYVLFRTGKAFLSLQPQDPMNFFNQLGKTFFRTVVVCAFLIQPAGVIGYWIVSPFVELAVSFNRVVLDSFTNASPTYVEMTDKEKKDMREWVQKQISDLQYGGGVNISVYATDEEKKEIQANLEQQVRDYTKYLDSGTNHSFSVLSTCDNVEMNETQAAADGRMFNEQIRRSLECMIKGLYSEGAYTIALASYMICSSFRSAMNGHIWWPNWNILLTGGSIWFAGFIIIIMFAFKIMDATVRMGVICALLPLLLVAWVFPVSAEYTKQGAKIMLQVMITYIVTAIIMALAIVIVMDSFSDNTDGFNLRQAFNANEAKAIAEHVSISAGLFFAGLISIILAILTMGTINKIAYEYGGVDFGNNASDSIGGMVTRITLMSAQAASRGMRVGVALAGTRVKDRYALHKQNKADKKSKAAAAKGTYNGKGDGKAGSSDDKGKSTTGTAPDDKKPTTGSSDDKDKSTMSTTPDDKKPTTDGSDDKDKSTTSATDDKKPTTDGSDDKYKEASSASFHEGMQSLYGHFGLDEERHFSSEESTQKAKNVCADIRKDADKRFFKDGTMSKEDYMEVVMITDRVANAKNDEEVMAALHHITPAKDATYEEVAAIDKKDGSIVALSHLGSTVAHNQSVREQKQVEEGIVAGMQMFNEL